MKKTTTMTTVIEENYTEPNLYAILLPQWKTFVSSLGFFLCKSLGKHINWLVFVCHRQTIGQRNDWASAYKKKNKITVINDSFFFLYIKPHKAIHYPLCNYPLKMCNSPSGSLFLLLSLCMCYSIFGSSFFSFVKINSKYWRTAKMKDVK